MDGAMVDLLIQNITTLKDLSPAQLVAIVAALKAYDDPASAKWRQDEITAIEAKGWTTAGLGAMSLASGQVQLKKCP
jgi:hypothetical protein